MAQRSCSSRAADSPRSSRRKITAPDSALIHATRFTVASSIATTWTSQIRSPVRPKSGTSNPILNLAIARADSIALGPSSSAWTRCSYSLAWACWPVATLAPDMPTASRCSSAPSRAVAETMNIAEAMTSVFMLRPSRPQTSGPHHARQPLVMPGPARRHISPWVVSGDSGLAETMFLDA